MDQKNKDIINKLDGLLEAKSGYFLPNFVDTFDIIDQKLKDNQSLFNKKIKTLGQSEEINKILDDKIRAIDKSLASNFTDINIYTLEDYKKFITRVFSWCPAQDYQGYFLKEDSARQILTDLEPGGIMEFFSYTSLEELFSCINPLEVLTISRYSETPHWQELYKQRLLECQENDFEKREVSFIFFDYKKFHKLLSNSGQPHKPWRLSHNKVSGIIMCFNIDDKDVFDSPFLQYISVFIHYFFETAFAGLYYDNVLKNNPEKIGAAVLASFTNHDGKFVFFNPNLYSETLYWEKAIDLIINKFKDIDFSFFTDTMTCGNFHEGDKKISLNIIDHIWNVNIKEGSNLYHFEEAFWKNLLQSIMKISDDDFEKAIVENLDMKDLEFTKYIINNFSK